MKIPDDQAPARDWFWYWVSERHAIYLRRADGWKQPWTDDDIFKRVHFTNISRQYDRVTQYLMAAVRGKSPPERIFQMALFRMYNRIETWEALRNFHAAKTWRVSDAITTLNARVAAQLPVTSPVWMSIGGVLTDPNRRKPHQNIATAIDRIHADRFDIAKMLKKRATLEELWTMYQNYEYVGPFVGLEMVADLVTCGLLNGAPDRNTWTYVNNGATRGLMRITGVEVKMNTKTKPRLAGGQPSALLELRQLLGEQTKRRAKHVPELTALDLEHCLCEFSKYERLRTGDTSYVRQTFTPRDAA